MTGPPIRSSYLLTGLIRCSRCGFAFQGWTVESKGIAYPKYADGGWKSKRVCSHFAISKELLESFAIKAIRDTLLEPSLIDKIEECVKALLAQELDNCSKRRQEVKAILGRKREMIRNLTEELAMGNRSESIRGRLTELEEDEARLLAEIASTKAEPTPSLSVEDISSAVSKFIMNFENEFERAAIEERKLLVRKCISHIVVDRDKPAVKFYVRRIPAVTPWLEEVLKTNDRTTGVVQSSSSGDPDLEAVGAGRTRRSILNTTKN